MQFTEVLAASNLDPSALTLMSRKLKVGLQGCSGGSIPPVENLSQPWEGQLWFPGQSTQAMVSWLQCLQGLPSPSLAFQPS